MLDRHNNARNKAAAYAKAWSSNSPDGVASFFAEDGRITINNGEPSIGRVAISAMASGFYAEFPDLVVHMDDFRLAGDHALFPWTLEGTHAQTGKQCRVPGFEEWTLNADGEIIDSLGWFDAVEYARQVADGI